MERLVVSRASQRKSTRSMLNKPLLPRRLLWFVCCKGSRCLPQATCTFEKETRGDWSGLLSWKTKTVICKVQLSTRQAGAYPMQRK